MSEPNLPLPTPPAPPAPPTAPVEDTSAQALSETFRSSFQFVKLAMVGLVIVFVCSGVFEVKPNEKAVILRFGRPVGGASGELLGPGWHWAWPYPIDDPVKIAIGEIKTVTSTAGWYATTPEMEARNEEPQANGILRPEADGYTLTADGNIIHVRARLKYRINKELRYAFGFDNAAAILTNVVNEAIFFASARFTADAALYKDKPGFRDAVLNRVRAQIEDLDLGVTLEPSDVETKAPSDVRLAFEAVNAAEQERSKAISDAHSYRNEVTSKALGEAAVLVNGGLTSSNRIVAEVGSLAARFSELLPEHRKSRPLFENRLLAATMGRVLTNAQDKFLLPADPLGRGRELRLQLSRPPLKSAETEAKP